MAKLYINGGRRLAGEIKVQGAKNSVLPILAATLLIKGNTVLHNCPDLSDVRAAIHILEYLGCKCTFSNGVAVIDATSVMCDTVPETLMREMRSSVVFLGAILSRCSSATITAPGGCEIGPRPIDIHLKSIAKMGYSVSEAGGYITCVKESSPTFCEITLDFPSVGATENIMLAACVSNGSVEIHNAAKEPEISDLAKFLNSAGANICGAGTDKITVCGVKGLSSTEHIVIPDRIAAATFMSAVAVSGGDVLMRDVACEHMHSVINSYKEMGCEINCDENELRIKSVGDLKRIKTTRSTVYPGFPTDSGPLLVAALTKADGTSVFMENIFENRFNYVEGLRRLGADIKVYGRVAVIEGVKALCGTQVAATDLRGGAALVIAALAAQGTTTVENLCYIERGYENIDKTLAQLSADVKKE